MSEEKGSINEKILVCRDPKKQHSWNCQNQLEVTDYGLRTDGRMDRETCQLKYCFRYT